MTELKPKKRIVKNLSAQEKDFVKATIPKLIGEGMEQDQAIAVALSKVLKKRKLS